MTILTIVLFIVSLGLLIVIHEFGHFTMAKLFKVYVMEFSIGFGPALLKKKKGETLYALRALPIGGYVMMYGEGSEGIPELANVPKERSLIGIAKWKRAIIMSAGIILNFVLAFLLFFVSNFAFAQRSLTNKLIIADGSVAANAGIQTNEILDFTAIDTGTIEATTDGGQVYYVTYVGFSSYEDSLGDAIVFSRVEGTETVYFVPDEATDTISFPITIKTVVSETETTSRDVPITLTAVATTTGTTTTYAWEDTGITFNVKTYRLNFFQAIAASGEQWWNGFTLIGKTLAGLFIGQGYENLGGVISIFTTTSSVFTTLGLGTYIRVWGLISVNIALFNILPFPGLDGWHLLVIAIEGITKKEIPSKIKNIISAVGLGLLLLLMVLLVFKDLFL